MIVFFFQQLAIFLGFALPVCLIQAIRAATDDQKSRYAALSSVCGGLLVLIFIAL